MADEIGHSYPQWHSDIAEDNWELRWPQSNKQFARMAREDAQVRSVIKAVSLPIQRTTWRIEPNGAPDEVVQLVAEDLRLPVLGDDGTEPIPEAKGHFSFINHLYWALQSLVYGSMYFEKVYREIDGRDRLWKLAPRMPDTIARINIAPDGGLESIEQNGFNDSLIAKRKAKAAKIPVERLVAYIHDPVMMDWRGTSMLRPAYKHWKYKDRFMWLESQVLERNGMGIPIYEASEPLSPGDDQSGEIERGRQMMQSVRAGSAAGLAIPHKSKVTIQGVNGQIQDPRAVIQYHDSQIGKAALAHFLNLEGKGGSYSLAEVQSNIFVQSLQTVADNIIDVFNRFVIEPLVDLAFDSEGGPYPVLACDPIGTKTDLTAESLATLVNAGVILPDKDLEEEMRRRSSLPSKRPYEFKDDDKPGDGAKTPDTDDEDDSGGDDGDETGAEDDT